MEVTTTRIIRLFISSTFSDLIAERNALHYSVFSRLRAFCTERNWRFQPIDLRWGVSADAVLEQRAMRICLGEVARCQRLSPRPNFLILLGQRYGWRPLPEVIGADDFEALAIALRSSAAVALLLQWYERDDNAMPAEYLLKPRVEDNADSTRWMVEIERPLRQAMEQAAMQVGWSGGASVSLQCSATEQEILRGALSVSDAREHVVAVFREFTTRPAGDMARRFLDCQQDGELDLESGRRQDSLKARIEAALGAANIIRYQTDCTENAPPSAGLGLMCEQVYSHLRATIESQIAQAEAVDAHQQEAELHRQFASEACEHFTGRETTTEMIMRYLETGGPHPLFLYGESGSGKTTLLAAISELARRKVGSACIVARFIGLTHISSRTDELLESLMCEIARRYGESPQGVSGASVSSTEAFLTCLRSGTSEHPLIIFIDGVDEVSETGPDERLAWLPRQLPAYCRLIVSAGEGESIRLLKQRIPEDYAVSLPLMPVDEATQLLDRWLNNDRRTLTAAQRGTLTDAFGPDNSPLTLKALYEGARQWRSFDPPVEQGKSPESVFLSLIERLASPAHFGPILVERTLNYLFIVKGGLAEDELLDLLAADHELVGWLRNHAKHELPQDGEGRASIPTALWCRLYAELEPYLAYKSGPNGLLIVFRYRQFRRAVEKLYAPERASVLHSALLARYFSSKELDERTTQELPWLLLQSTQWRRLQDLLGEREYLQAMWKIDRHALLYYWDQLEIHSEHRLTKAYAEILAEPLRFAAEALVVGEIFIMSARHERALRLYESLEKQCEGHNRTGEEFTALIGGARALLGLGELDRATEKLARAVDLSRAEAAGLSATALPDALNLQGHVLEQKGQCQEAQTLYEQAGTICREILYRRGEAAALCGLARVALLRNELLKADDFSGRASLLCREIGQWHDLQNALGIWASVASKQQRGDTAKELIAEQKEICAHFGLESGMAHALMQEALLHSSIGRDDIALPILEEASGRFEMLGEKVSAANCLAHRSRIKDRMGHSELAIQLAAEAQALAGFSKASAMEKDLGQTLRQMTRQAGRRIPRWLLVTKVVCVCLYWLVQLSLALGSISSLGAWPARTAATVPGKIVLLLWLMAMGVSYRACAALRGDLIAHRLAGMIYIVYGVAAMIFAILQMRGIVFFEGYESLKVGRFICLIVLLLPMLIGVIVGGAQNALLRAQPRV